MNTDCDIESMNTDCDIESMNTDCDIESDESFIRVIHRLWRSVL